MKLVVRMLTRDRELLGWQEVWGRMPGDGTVTVPSHDIPADQGGIVDSISVHWCDLNVEFKRSLGAPMSVAEGFRYSIPTMTIEVGEPPVELPPITTRGSVSVEVPTGSLSAK